MPNFGIESIGPLLVEPTTDTISLMSGLCALRSSAPRLASRKIAHNSAISIPKATASRKAQQTRSVGNKPAYEGHIPLNSFENAFLAVGSAFMSLADPRRGGECHSDFERLVKRLMLDE